MTLRASANASLTNFDEAYENVLAAWQAASAPGEILPPVDTDFFPVTTLVTAKLFSTRDDYKGGEWRKRCQDKSWYTETIYGNQIGVGYYANEAAARAVSGAIAAGSPELVTNGTFGVSTTGWTGTNVTPTRDTNIFAGGGLKLVSTSTANLYASQSIATVVGRTYVVTADMYAPSANSSTNAAKVMAYDSPSRGASLGDAYVTAEDAIQTKTFTFTATTTTTHLECEVADSVAWGASGDIAYFDNITLKEYDAANAVTNDYYYDTTAGLFKALNADSGTTTIYRGGRREFPENFIVTVESARVVIWDCDFGAPRMWMVINRMPAGAGIWGDSLLPATSCVYKNGKLVIGCSNGTYGTLLEWEFLFDNVRRSRVTAVDPYVGIVGPISSRHVSFGTSEYPGGLTLVSEKVNAVAITNLPNAPLDEYGMPADTLSVGTDGGVTVLGWDGVQDNVAWDIVMNTYPYSISVGFDSDNRAVFTFGNGAAVGWVITAPIPTADVTGFTYSNLPTGYSSIYGTYVDADQSFGPFEPAQSYSGVKVNSIAGKNRVRTPAGLGLELYRENLTTPTRGMGAKITHTYNSGTCWGGIRRAWLADTTAETITASGELITNGAFDTNTTGWSAGSDAILSSVSGKLNVTNSATDYGYAYQAITTVVGKTYNITVDVTSGVYKRVSVGSSVGSNNLFTTTSTATETVRGSFTATTTTTYISLICNVTTDAAVAEFDNISVKLAEPDRCVKNKALTVVGSLTKAAVASGANLVAYSGFSASNYLEEAYSSDLDFGTGEHGRVFWLKEAANSAQETIFQRDSASTGQRIYAHITAGGTIVFGCDDNTTDRAATSTATVDDGIWHLYWLRYDGAGGVYIYRDGSSTPLASATGAALLTLNNSSAYVRVGVDSAAANPLTNGSLVMKRISATDMTMQQWAEIYEQEKKLFEVNAQCTLAGTSSAVLAADQSKGTGVLGSATSYGFNYSKGLVRVSSNATTVGTPKAISMGDRGEILEVGSTGIRYFSPAKNLREELPTDLGDKPRQLFDFDLSSATTCTLPQGWKPTGAVWSAGAKKRQGAAKDFTTSYDGFLWSVVMTSSTTAWVQVEGEHE